MPGWNSVNKVSTVAKPNLWRLMKTFQREECAAKAKCASIVTGKWNDMSVDLNRVLKMFFNQPPTQTPVHQGPIKIVRFRNTEISKMVL